MEDLEDLRTLKRLRSDSSEDDEAASVAVLLEGIGRDKKLYRKRWDSEYLRELAIKEGSFLSEYRVDPGGFDILVTLLEKDLTRNEKFAMNSLSGSSKAVTVDSRVGAALIMLAGGRRIEAMRTHGLSQAMVYTNLHEVVRAINKHPALAISCPTDKASLCARAADFAQLSTHGLFKYCTGAIDGLAIRIRAPSVKEVANQTRFYNGNKKFFSLNMQGVCDAKRRFIAVSCKHVGSTNDVDAFQTCDLRRLNEEQSFPHHWNGDAAYCASETLMVPYSGVNLKELFPEKEWFNFWHSQVRIYIECTFGIFIQRWGIFWTDLQFSIENVIAIVHACVRLHNFCTDRALDVEQSVKRPPTDRAQVGKDGRLLDDTWRMVEAEKLGSGGTTLRELLLEKVTEKQLIHERSIVRK
jgi:hypothetical protein